MGPHLLLWGCKRAIQFTCSSSFHFFSRIAPSILASMTLNHTGDTMASLTLKIPRHGGDTIRVCDTPAHPPPPPLCSFSAPHNQPSARSISSLEISPVSRLTDLFEVLPLSSHSLFHPANTITDYPQRDRVLLNAALRCSFFWVKCCVWYCRWSGSFKAAICCLRGRRNCWAVNRAMRLDTKSFTQMR